MIFLSYSVTVTIFSTAEHWFNKLIYFLGETCDGFDAGGRCPRAAEYVPDVDSDLQGIFDHTEDLIESLFK